MRLSCRNRSFCHDQEWNELSWYYLIKSYSFKNQMFSSYKYCIHRILEKLLEFLSFCAKVIPLSHSFLRNLFNLLNRLSHLHSYIIHCLFSTIRCDLLWWMTFLSHWSSIRLIIFSQPQIIIHTNVNKVKEIDDW